jgi:hypothetical protein
MAEMLAPTTPLRELNAAPGVRRGRVADLASPAKTPFRSPFKSPGSTQSPLSCLSPNNDAAEKARVRKAKADQENARMCGSHCCLHPIPSRAEA